MCGFCKKKKKKKNTSNCYANFSAPRCNRTTPRTKIHRANDLSVYHSNSCCAAHSCCDCCEPECGFAGSPFTTYAGDCFSNTVFPFGESCDIPKKCCN